MGFIHSESGFVDIKHQPLQEHVGRNLFSFGQLCVHARDESQQGAFERQHVRTEHGDIIDDNIRPILTRFRHMGLIPTKVRNPPRDFATSGRFRNVLRVAA